MNSTRFNINFWVKLSLFHLFLLACIGILMRYKIGFEFPYFYQKYLLHAHSHFAFYAWVSQILMAFMIYHMRYVFSDKNILWGNYILWINVFLSYVMLVSFTIQGYKVVSITASSLSVCLSMVFSWFYIRYTWTYRNKYYGIRWFIAALIFNIISSIGTFYLAYMMASHNINQNNYLASVYFYLHFQYNGWFFFGCMGIFIQYIQSLLPDKKFPGIIIVIFSICCIPAFLLSVLWADIPMILYILAILASVFQLFAWVLFLKYILNIWNQLRMHIPKYGKYIFLILAGCISVKFLLQTGSTVPELSKLAFGFRPVVIAYLHLNLLNITSLFLVTSFFLFKILSFSLISRIGLFVFIIGIFLNLLLLTLQGIFSFSYILIPYINVMLLIASVLIGISVLLLLFSKYIDFRNNQ